MIYSPKSPYFLIQTLAKYRQYFANKNKAEAQDFQANKIAARDFASARK